MLLAGTRDTLSLLILIEKLHVILLRDEGKSTTSIADDPHVTEPVMTEILQSRSIHKYSFRTSSRPNNLCRGENTNSSSSANES